MSAGRPRTWFLVAGGALVTVIVAWSLASTPADAARAPCPEARTQAAELNQAKARQAVRCLVNRERTGLRKLKLRGSLSGPALKHSRKMRRHRCLLHVCPGEPATLIQRLDRYARGAGARVGEVIALNGASASPRAVVRQWMGSAPHRHLLRGRFQHLGVGFSANARLAYWTVDLGARR